MDLLVFASLGASLAGEDQCAGTISNHTDERLQRHVRQQECQMWLHKWPAPTIMTAMYGQDSWLLHHLFRSTTHGIYIDAAAFHPRRSSTTYAMDVCLQWRGICIEGDPKKHAAFLTPPCMRSCQLETRCVSSRQGEVVHFRSATFEETSGIREQPSTRLGRRTISLNCTTLTAVLLSWGIRNVDFMSLDVEGAEEAVLQGLDLSLFSIDVIMMEVHDPNDTLAALAIYKERGQQEQSKNANRSNPARRAVSTLLRNGYKLVHLLGGELRYNHQPLDTLWVHAQSEWWSGCKWEERDSTFGPMWTPLQCTLHGKDLSRRAARV